MTPLKTGWPMPALMQDDDRKLFRWFASKPDARRLVRESVSSIVETEMKLTKPRLRLRGRVWSCSVCQDLGFGWSRVLEIGYGYTPWTAWLDLQSRLFDLEAK